MKQTETIGGRKCTIYTAAGAEVLLLQAVDDHDQSLLDSEVATVRSLTDVPFNLVAFGIKEWMRELKGALPAVMGGYSLAGLFSLWAGYNSSLFDGIAAASPSVWYPQWTDYTEGRPMHSKAVYLSLGDSESRTKNPVMAHVDDAIRRQQELLSAQGVDTTLVWNAGNHFVDSEKRMAKAFAWVVQRLSPCRLADE